jgi:hypothetical protein
VELGALDLAEQRGEFNEVMVFTSRSQATFAPGRTRPQNL